jgi:nitroreductase
MHEPMSPFRFLRSLWRILRQKPQLTSSLWDNPTLALILKRRSVREYKQEDIPEEVFAAILEAGRFAPTTVNLQTWACAIFDQATWRETFGTPIPFRGARAVLILGDTHRNQAIVDEFPYSPMVEYTLAVMNASLVAMTMTLAAEALGVSSVMLSETGRTGLLDAGFLQEKLSLPEKVYPLMTIVFGYARGGVQAIPPRLPRELLCVPGGYREDTQGIVDEWLLQMRAGYKAQWPKSSFEAQLSLYHSKISQAEADLQRMVFYGGGPAAIGGEEATER